MNHHKLNQMNQQPTHLFSSKLQWQYNEYIPRNMHIDCSLLCYVEVWYLPFLPVSFKVTSMTLRAKVQKQTRHNKTICLLLMGITIYSPFSNLLILMLTIINHNPYFVHLRIMLH